MKQQVEFISYIDEANKKYRQPVIGLYKIGKNYFIDFADSNYIKIYKDRPIISKRKDFEGGIYIKGILFACNKKLYDSYNRVGCNVIWIGDSLATMEFFSRLGG